jgi:hypothetical protein
MLGSNPSPNIRFFVKFVGDEANLINNMKSNTTDYQYANDNSSGW